MNAIIAAAQEDGYEPAVLEVNDRQPDWLLELLADHVNLEGARIAVLGLAFKPNTDDIRNSRAIFVIDSLLSHGADVTAYDPVASDEMVEQFPEINYAKTPADALRGADGALVVTDWEEFTDLDTEFDEMATPVVIDGRRCIERRDGIVYEGLTR